MGFKVPAFLKWAGGKRNILTELDSVFPKKFNNYFEPFIGGGAVFFYVKQKYNPKQCTISDINRDLIYTYLAVRDRPRILIKHLRYYKSKNSKELFYKIRADFNKNRVRGLNRCAAFIYLNKTCFNGLYRVNSQNEFNVPYANYKSPEIFDEETILLASQLLDGVNIVLQDYREILKNVNTGDFVYLDPCYDPIKKTSFDKYTPKKFSEEDRVELAKFIYRLRIRGCFVVLSNNDIPAIHSMYEDFNIKKIWCYRFINSKGDGRGKIPELIISNFK